MHKYSAMYSWFITYSNTGAIGRNMAVRYSRVKKYGANIFMPNIKEIMPGISFFFFISVHPATFPIV